MIIQLNKCKESNTQRPFCSWITSIRHCHDFKMFPQRYYSFQLSTRLVFLTNHFHIYTILILLPKIKIIVVFSLIQWFIFAYHLFGNERGQITSSYIWLIIWFMIGCLCFCHILSLFIISIHLHVLESPLSRLSIL